MKIAGYVFLAGGLALMLYGLFDGYMVFKGAKAPPNVFKETAKKTATAKIDIPIGGQNIKVPLSGLEGMFPDFNQIFNLSVEFFLVSIFLSAGHKIAGLGINLIKK